MNTVTVKINGMEYNLKGKENQEYLLGLAGYVDGKLREIMNKNSKLSSTAVAVLTCLNIGDELSKCDKEAAELIEKVKVLEGNDLKSIKRIEEVTEKAKKFLSSKDEEINSLKETIKAMEEQVIGMNELNEKVKLLTNELKEIDILKSEIENLNIENEMFKEELNIKEVECEEYKESTIKLRNEIREVKETTAEELRNELNNNNVLKNKIKELDVQAIYYKEELEIKEIECEEYKENVVKLSNEINEVKETMDENIRNEMKNNEVLKSEIEELSLQAISYKEELNIKETECANYKENAIKLNDEINKVKSMSDKEYEKITREIKLLSSGNDDLRSAVEDSYSKISVLEDENSKLLQFNEKLDKEIKSKEKELRDKDREIEEREKELKNKNEEILDKEKQITESVSRDESNKYKEELESLGQQITIMEEELKSNIRMKEKIKVRSKEMHFQLQNSKFRVLDLEKKILDVQIELAKSRKEKNVLLK